MDAEQIKKNLVDQLYWDSRVDASDINVDVEEGEVTLEGKVPSYFAKQSANSVAWTIAGVTSVNNNLTVEYPAGVNYPNDEEVEESIENILLWDTEIDSTEIRVNVSENTVTLEGTVDYYWKKDKAERLADIAGVFAIVNKIAVVPTKDIIDKDVAQDVVDAVDRNVNVDVDNMNVEVEDGVVTLTGTVRSWTALRAAENSASFTLGVVDVENRLTVA